MQSLLRDFGFDAAVHLLSDATAVIGIVRRLGLGRVRHLATADLWIQQRIRRGGVRVSKWPGTDNPADLMTKHKDKLAIEKYMQTMGFALYSGRPAASPSRTEGWSIAEPVDLDRPAAPPKRKEGSCERGGDDTRATDVSVQCMSQTMGSCSPPGRDGNDARPLFEPDGTPSCGLPQSIGHVDTLCRLVREERRCTSMDLAVDSIGGADTAPTDDRTPWEGAPGPRDGTSDEDRGKPLGADVGASAESGCGDVAQGTSCCRSEEEVDAGDQRAEPNDPYGAYGRLVQFYASYHPGLLRARDAMDGVVGHV